MLVLSRKSAEEIVFPALGITIRVLRTTSNTVKLGVEVPKHFQVVRGELASCDDLINAIGDLKSSIDTHEMRNRLNVLLLKLELLRRAEQKGLSTEVLELVESAAIAMSELDAEFGRLVTPVKNESHTPVKTRLMVVDDDANERELLAAVLSLHGFEVSAAHDGVDAIEQLNVDPIPHAVLLDLRMPRLCGEQTLRCIRSDRRLANLKVLGISGSEPRQHMLPDGLRGFDAWFPKPLDLERLVQLVNLPVTNLQTVECS